MRAEPRCPRIKTETWVAPGRTTAPDWPGTQTRTMRARCVLGVDHVLSENDTEARHVYGDWLEIGDHLA